MRTLLDTGPLVALFNKRDQHHTWAREQVAGLGRPFYTCEAVLTEAYHLLSDVPTGVPRLHALLRRERLEVSFAIQEHQQRIIELMETYENVPMSFADACLVLCQPSNYRLSSRASGASAAISFGLAANLKEIATSLTSFFPRNDTTIGT